MRDEMFKFIQYPAGAIKQIATKTTNMVIMSGLGIGIGSALLLSLLRHVFGRARKVEAISAPEDEQSQQQKKDDQPLVFLVTQKKTKPESQPSSFPSTSSSSLQSSSSTSSTSSESQVTTNAQVSEIELEPLPELMLLDENCLRDKLKNDYIVLVVPRKSGSSRHDNEDDDDERDVSSVADREGKSSKSPRARRSSLDISISRILNNSLQRLSHPQLPAQEEMRRLQNLEEEDDDDDDSGNVREGDCDNNSSPDPEGSYFSIARDVSLLSTAGVDSAYMFTSTEMRSIFESGPVTTDSLENYGSDVMKKLSDIEEKLCLVHVDTDDMMSYINAVKRSEKISGILSRPQYVCYDHLATSTPSNGSLVDDPSFRRETEFAFNLDLNEEDAAPPRNFDEWSFEDQLGDPNDISF